MQESHERKKKTSGYRILAPPAGITQVLTTFFKVFTGKSRQLSQSPETDFPQVGRQVVYTPINPC